jgi:isocitrate dehydrogenase
MTRITVAKGDGIGPEIMDATLRIILQLVQLEIDEIEVEKKFIYPNTSGITSESWDIIRTNKIFSKSTHYNSSRWRLQKLNVTTRKFL